ncbi:MAG: hypothetical protein KGJ49_11195 [Alphaproteobacteria bacterium]|nr:hypothetical protein [Alphaproteobacteria bacterium]
MHPFFFGAIHHVLLVAVFAFFVLFAASKADGFVKILGNVLGYLLLIAAVLMILCAAIGPMFGGRTMGFIGTMHPGWGYHMMQSAPPAQPATPAQPAKPAPGK